MKLGIVAWYEYHKAYIAKNLCENRDKPAMKCCGKCYLQKKLAKAEAGDLSSGTISLLTRMDVSPFILPAPLRLRPVFPEENPLCFHYALPFAEPVSFSIEHPPG
jgi:hypothetical protein